MKQSPTVLPPLHWSLVPDCTPQIFESLQVQFSIYSMSIWDEFSVHNTITVKEENQHQLVDTHLQTWFGWSLLTWLHPLRTGLLGLWLIAMKPGFITTHNVHWVVPPSQQLKSSTGTSDSAQLFGCSQQVGDPGGRAFFDSNFFAQSCVNTAMRQVCLGSQLSDCLASVLIQFVSHLLHCFRSQLSWSWIVIPVTQVVVSSSDPSMPPEHRRLAQSLSTMYPLQSVESLLGTVQTCSSFIFMLRTAALTSRRSDRDAPTSVQFTGATASHSGLET